MSNKHHLNNEDVRKFTDEELGIEIENQRAKLFTARSQMVTEKVEDHSQFGAIKRNVARMLTEQSVRRLKLNPKTYRTPGPKQEPRSTKPPGRPSRAAAKKRAGKKADQPRADTGGEETKSKKRPAAKPSAAKSAPARAGVK